MKTFCLWFESLLFKVIWLSFLCSPAYSLQVRENPNWGSYSALAFFVERVQAFPSEGLGADLHVLSILIAHFQSRCWTPSLQGCPSPSSPPPLIRADQVEFFDWKTNMYIWRLHFEVGCSFRVMVNTTDCRDLLSYFRRHSDEVSGKPIVSVPSAITKYHKLGGLNDRNLFLPVLEAGSPRSRCRRGWFLVRQPFLACRWPSSRRVLTWPFLCVSIPLPLL